MKYNVTIEFSIKTKKDKEKISKCLERGIYWELDREGECSIATPENVSKITFNIKEDAEEN